MSEMTDVKLHVFASAIAWRGLANGIASPRGRYAVVQGPFPYALLRSLTSGKPDVAITRLTGTIVARPATTHSDYAKVRISSLIIVNDKYGEYSP